MNTIKVKSGTVKMVAHRGVSGLERENTCPAFVAAGNRSYWGIETDIHKTADGRFVVIHDDSTKRVSLEAVDIHVEQNPYAALKDVVLPDLDGSRNRQDIRIPLLEDYVKICKKYDKYCVLELKNALAKEDIKAVVEEICTLDYLDKVVFISFILENCLILRKLLPNQPIQWLTGNPVEEKEIALLKEEAIDLDIYYVHVTKELVDTLHAQGTKINCWTCDDKEKAEELAQMGVDFITSNILE